MNSVTFNETVPDGKYMGVWREFDVTIIIDGKEIKGRCEAGVPKADGLRFSVVTVENGRATLNHAL